MNQRPFWAFLPYINNRTAWRPIGFPAVLVIPFGATNLGTPAAQSSPINVTVSILDTVRRNRISGPFIGESYYPSHELFTINLDAIEIARRQIDINDFVINDDVITITNRKGVSGDIPYIQNSLYYDLSDIELDVENLASGRYQISYSASIYKRIYDSTGYLICINTNESDSIINFVDFVHPGEVIDEMKKTTPSIWFSDTKLSKDPLITLYKPLSDSIQNVYDEQTIISRINFVNNAYPEIIPHLGRILGWEIPYFPKSLDQLRKSVIRTTVDFQKNRNSYKGIVELFELFGFDILIRNLWFDTDNKTLLEPQYQGITGIDIVDETQFDVLNANLIAPGFYKNEIQLLKRPSIKSEFDNFTSLGSNTTIEAYAVKIGSQSHNAIEAYLTQHNLGIVPEIAETKFGFVNNDLMAFIHGTEIYASQSLYVDKNSNIISQTQTGIRKILNDDIKLYPIKPSINITLDGNWSDPNIAIYIFAIYKTQNIIPIEELLDKRSNYFDIRLASAIDDSLPTNIILDYALDFLFRIKAFHSLLHRIFTTININDVYLVGDYCYGPGLSRKSDTNIGQQQVPPAIMPTNSSGDCIEQDATLLGYKESDIIYRNNMTTGLIEEWSIYTTYDTREYQYSILFNMLPQYPNHNRSIGIYNEYGQDAFVNSYNVMHTFSIETPGHYANQNIGLIDVEYFDYNDTYFKINNRNTGFRHNDILYHNTQYDPAPDLSVREPICFKGRVNDELSVNAHIPFDELYSSNSCTTTMGIGAFFTTPRRSMIIKSGAVNRLNGSMSSTPIISSFRATSGELFDDNWNNIHSNIALNPVRIIGNCDVVLHYWNRPESLDASWNSAALQVPSLDIQKTDMHFPGTRFISMSDYNGDFISDVYELRPWDQNICDKTLNPIINIGTDGNEYLTFDHAPFRFSGNGVDSDLPKMGLPTFSTINQNQVVHSIYSEFADIEDDTLCMLSSGIINMNGIIEITDLNEEGGVTIDDAIFKSVSNCNGVLIDYADGYPCVTGVLNITPDIDSPYFTAMALPPSQYLFTLGSGIKDGSVGLRLDCGCLKTPCDLTNQENNNCDIIKEPDRFEPESRLVFFETIGSCNRLMDGSITTMFELIN